ncbi:MAG: hypothetical protein ACYDDB_08905 [bacterium]
MKTLKLFTAFTVFAAFAIISTFIWFGSFSIKNAGAEQTVKTIHVKTYAVQYTYEQGKNLKKYSDNGNAGESFRVAAFDAFMGKRKNNHPSGVKHKKNSFSFGAEKNKKGRLRKNITNGGDYKYRRNQIKHEGIKPQFNPSHVGVGKRRK